MANGNKPSATQVFGGLVVLALTIFGATQAWAFKTIVRHESQISAMDAADRVNDDWLKQRMDRQQVQLDRIEAKLDGMD